MIDRLTPVFAQQGGAQPMDPMLMIGYMVLMFAIVYMLFIRPSQRREKETRSMQESLKKGNRVYFGHGIVGQVASMKDAKEEGEPDLVVLEISKGVKIEVRKDAIQGIIPNASMKNTASERAS